MFFELVILLFMWHNVKIVLNISPKEVKLYLGYICNYPVKFKFLNIIYYHLEKKAPSI